LPDKRIRHDVVMHLKKSLSADEKEVYSQAELEQIAGEKWLNKQAENKGFKVLSVIAQGYQQHQFKKRGIKISTLDFQGLLEVTDPKLFFEKVFYGKIKEEDNEPRIRGIGSAKAFGCGLMLIKRA
jgi:CRISPR system Cascade subunit CasE